jgi:SAM-dependent methyltransferase
MFGRRRRSVRVTGEDLKRLELLLELLNDTSQPNHNALLERVRDLSLMALNIKAFGYDLGRRLAAELPVGRETSARHVGLQSKATTQADMESDWVAHWCGQLQTPVLFHRKLWELSYVLQAVHEHGHMREGARGLGFGCGEESLPSYLASRGVEITVTDLAPEEAEAKGWASSRQHAGSLDKAYHSIFLDRETFDRRVSLRQVDMNAIPPDLRGFDFCWSVCALEHLGSLAKGLDFVRNSLDTLRPGGLAVHTTEYNINPDGPTVDNWPTVLFQRRHLEGLADRLRADGHQVAPFDFDYGDKPMDRFIDLPPWSHTLPEAFDRLYGHSLHLKLGLEGFPCTCFGLIVTKVA